MRIEGNWIDPGDGVSRPFVNVQFIGPMGATVEERMLVDTGADRSLISAEVFRKAGLVASGEIPDYHLEGLTGTTAFVFAEVRMEFTTFDGQPVGITGRFAAVPECDAIDDCILGRDVLSNFDLVVGARNGEILLLAGNHGYRVVP